MKYAHEKPIKPIFIQKGLEGFQFPLTSRELEIDYIDCWFGHDDKVISDSLMHIYYVLEGSGDFQIDTRLIHVSKGMCVEIPPNHIFTYFGKMKLLLIVQPPYSKDRLRKVA